MKRLAYTLAIATLMLATPAIGSAPATPPVAPEQPVEVAHAQATAEPAARLICKNEVPVGSRLLKKVCRTPEADADVRRVGRELTEHGQRLLLQ